MVAAEFVERAACRSKLFETGETGIKSQHALFVMWDAKAGVSTSTHAHVRVYETSPSKTKDQFVKMLTASGRNVWIPADL